MPSRFRIVAANVSLAMLLVLVGLWVRSYQIRDVVSWKFRASSGTIVNRYGEVMAFYQYDDPNKVQSPFEYQYRKETGDFKTTKVDRYLGFSWHRYRMKEPMGRVRFTLPYWCLTFVAALRALLIRPAPRFRMSRRELIVITAAFAVILGVAFAL